MAQLLFRKGRYILAAKERISFTFGHFRFWDFKTRA